MTVMGLWSSLDELVLHKDVSALRKRLQKGADTNKRATSDKKLHRTPLHTACLSGHVESAELLLSFGADVEARDDGGQTPLHYAARHCHMDVLDLLLRWKADHFIRDKDGLLPAHHTDPVKGAALHSRLRSHSMQSQLEVCYFESGKWVPYDKAAAMAVACDMGGGSRHCALVTGNGSTYIVDFQQQLQINVQSFFVKSIAWRVPPRGQWNFPPTPFQGLHPASQDPRLLAPYAALLAELERKSILPPSAKAELFSLLAPPPPPHPPPPHP